MGYTSILKLILYVCLFGCSPPLPPSAPPPSTDPLIVKTVSGSVHGESTGSLRIFRGIPYAAPPLGGLRFRPPELALPWSDVREAKTLAPPCPQPESPFGDSIQYSEDCLYLNIWAHADDRKRPIMVFIHGGGYVVGSGGLALIDGAKLAQAGDVVVATINYRLGMLGFLATQAIVDNADGGANWGMRDQIAALQWIKENAATFGADPNNITIFGESAGGGSVCILLGSPLSAGLYHRAIIESGGGCYGFPKLNEAVGNSPALFTTGDAFVASTTCKNSSADAVVPCLRGLTVAAILMAQGTLPSGDSGLPSIRPGIDGVVLKGQPLDSFRNGSARDVPIITGSNADEMMLFLATTPILTEAAYKLAVLALAPFSSVKLLEIYPASSFANPKAAYVALTSDLRFICPSLSFVEAAAGGSSPAWTYLFTQKMGGPQGALLGAYHSAELGFVFDTLGTLEGVTPTDADKRVVLAMQRAWSTFAWNGTPSPDPAWPSWTVGTPKIILISDPLDITPAIRNGRCVKLREMGLVS